MYKVVNNSNPDENKSVQEVVQMNSKMYICTNNAHMAKPLEEFDDNKLGNNPFTNSLLIPVTKTFSPDQFTFHKNPGEEGPGTFLPSGFYIDKVQSARLYYSAGAKDLVYGLSDKAQRMYLYILYNMIKGKQHIQMNKENYMTRNNVKSRITYGTALKELIRYGFITNTCYKTVFWVNPMLFSANNRIKMYPKNLDVRGEL